MGIQDRIDPFSRVIQITDLNAQSRQEIPECYTSDDASSVASEQPIIRPPRRTRNTRAEAIDLQSLSNRLHCKSRRHAKRHNHLSFVKTLVGLEESEIEDDFAWMPENYGKSIFSSLFSESSKMKAWNAFIEMNEDDQMAMIEQHHVTKSEQCQITEDMMNLELNSVNTNASGDNSDKRKAHPSYSSEACFKQINQNIKNLLNRRHLPLGLLESIEKEIRGSFLDCPYSVYEPDTQTSFGRLLVHAVTQYLGLESFSFDSQGTRTLTVVNKTETFNPPSQLLSEFLEWKSGKHQILQ